MKTRFFQILIFSFLVSGLWGCGGVSQQEYDNLKAENEKLKQEIEDLKYGPDKLLAKVKSNIENKEYQNALQVIQLIETKHSGSVQAKEAQELAIIAENGIKEKEVEEEKAVIEAEKAEKVRLANATKNMTKEYDEIKEITWYRDKSSPAYVNYNGFYAYIGKTKTGKPWLRIAIQYAADDWLFIQKYIIKVDGVTYTISPESYGEIKTDNGSGGIWEWLDRKVTITEYEIIKAVANGSDTKIRFSGKDYHKDKIITSQQKTALRNVLDAYIALGGDGKF